MKKERSIVNSIARFLSWAARLVFVPKCIVCKDVLEGEGEYCPECRGLLESARRKKCPICQKTARACQCRPMYLWYTDKMGERVVSSLAFYGKFGSEEKADIFVRHLVFAVKRDEDRSSVRAVGRDLSHEILRTLLLSGEDIKDWKITYPPRSKKRINKFGFDHAREMAEAIGKYTGMQVENTFVNKRGKTQKSLNSLERKENARSAYEIAGGQIKGNYIIVDDVITTGATVDACARLLKEAGACKVYPACIARTKTKKRPRRRPSSRPWFRSK